MKKHILEYISVLGILLCAGIIFIQHDRYEKLSMQYESLQESVSQMLENKEINKQTVSVNGQQTFETPIPSYYEWEGEGPTMPVEESSRYDLVKYSYLYKSETISQNEPEISEEGFLGETYFTPSYWKREELIKSDEESSHYNLDVTQYLAPSTVNIK